MTTAFSQWVDAHGPRAALSSLPSTSSLSSNEEPADDWEGWQELARRSAPPAPPQKTVGREKGKRRPRRSSQPVSTTTSTHGSSDESDREALLAHALHRARLERPGNDARDGDDDELQARWTAFANATHQRLLQKIVAHQLESYDALFGQLERLYLDARPLQEVQHDGVLCRYRVVELAFLSPVSPTGEAVTPEVCFQRQLSYESVMMATVEETLHEPWPALESGEAGVVTPERDHDPRTWWQLGRRFHRAAHFVRRFPPTEVGRLPLMRLARGCVEREGLVSPTLDRAQSQGGNFIPSGAAKVMGPTARLLTNFPVLKIVKAHATGPYTHSLELRCMHAQRRLRSSSNIVLGLVGYQRLQPALTQLIFLTMPYVPAVPIMLLWLALGWSVPQVLRGLRLAAGHAWSSEMEPIVARLVAHTHGLSTQREALLHLGKICEREFANDDERVVGARKLLQQDFLVQLGHSVATDQTKGLTLCDLTVRLLLFGLPDRARPERGLLGRLDETDRDDERHTLYDVPAQSLLLLWHQLLKVNQKNGLKALRDAVEARKPITDIGKLFNGQGVSSRVAECLSTGTWGANRASNRMRTGMSQPQQQMNASATLAQLRRIHCPNAKNDRIDKRRHLHAHSYKRFDPCETPDGPTVGLVRHLAMGARISSGSDPAVLATLLLLGPDGGPSGWIPLSRWRELVATTPPEASTVERLRGWPDHSFEDELRELTTLESAETQPNQRVQWPITDVSLLGEGTSPEELAEAEQLRTTGGQLPPVLLSLTQLWLNGVWLGWVRRPEVCRAAVWSGRRSCSLDPETSVAWQHDGCRNELRLSTEPGRMLRFFATEQAVRRPPPSPLPHHWSILALQAHGLIELLDADEESVTRVAHTAQELRASLLAGDGGGLTHCELHPDQLFGTSIAMVPFPTHSQCCRLSYQSGMGKQVAQVSSEHPRGAAVTYVLASGQRPLVFTCSAEGLGHHRLVLGTHVRVAIMAYKNNQEDALIMSKALVDSGAFNLSALVKYVSEQTKYGSNTNCELFEKPDTSTTRGLHAANYQKLDRDGLVPEGTFVDDATVLIGKTGPGNNLSASARASFPNSMRVGEQAKRQDVSKLGRKGERGTVLQTLLTSSRKQLRSVLVLVRVRKRAQIGDKFSSRYGQKGTIGLVEATENMPFDVHGQRIDLIVNAHYISTRKTWSQTIEALVAQAMALGMPSRALPSLGGDVEALLHEAGQVLKANGLAPDGKERLYHGETGELMEGLVSLQFLYMERLDKLADNKKHARSRYGKMHILTHQPSEGRRQDGGLRIGYMESDAIYTHGAAQLQQERTVQLSDEFCCYVCHLCGYIGEANPDEAHYYCRHCDRINTLWQLYIPYAFKLVIQEMFAIGLAIRLDLAQVAEGPHVWCSQARSGHPDQFSLDDYQLPDDLVSSLSAEAVAHRRRRSFASDRV